MPIYEYQCESCAHQFETIQKVSEPVLTDCPECGDSALKKLVSKAAFRLKGTGWYETDFKSTNKRNVAEGSKPAPESTSSDSTSTSDSSSSASASPAPKKSDGGGKAA